MSGMHDSTSHSQRIRQADEALRRFHQGSTAPFQFNPDQHGFSGPVFFGFEDIPGPDLTSELRRMVDLGFDMVRFYTAYPAPTGVGTFDWSRPDLWMNAAAEAGIRVIFHTEWFTPTKDLLQACGYTSPEAYLETPPDDPRYQQVLERQYRELVERYRHHPALFAWGTLGEPDPPSPELSSAECQSDFGNWLQEQYGTLQALDQVWNAYPRSGSCIVDSFEHAYRALDGYKAQKRISGVNRALRNYGAGRDLCRFLTERFLQRGQVFIESFRKWDPDHPVSTGMHQLQTNMAALRWDPLEWAQLGDLSFSSVHLPWHFQLAGGEVDRPVYMQARQTRDWRKFGWTSVYEATGGPVQYSGGLGNHMDPGLMRRLLFSYLAAGNTNFSFWCWNPRPAGWEAGEYGLVDLAGNLTPWGKEAGRISKVVKAYRQEIEADETRPHVGILTHWDNEAVHSLEPPKESVKTGIEPLGVGTAQQPERARIGASRVCLDHQIPFEYITEAELAAGGGLRYPVLYAPHLRAVHPDVLDTLQEYVRAGGHLIADVEFAFLDAWGKLHAKGADGVHATLFDASIDTIHDARTTRRSLNGCSVEGFYGDLHLHGATPLAFFDQEGVAASQVRLGNGRATLLAFDAAMLAWKPGHPEIARWLAGLLKAGYRPELTSSLPLTHHKRTGNVHHIFLINPGEATQAWLELQEEEIQQVLDPVTGEELDLTQPLSIPVETESARWIRLTT